MVKEEEKDEIAIPLIEFYKKTKQLTKQEKKNYIDTFVYESRRMLSFRRNCSPWESRTNQRKNNRYSSRAL